MHLGMNEATTRFYLIDPQLRFLRASPWRDPTMTEIIIYDDPEVTVPVQVTLDGGNRLADPGPNGRAF